MTRTAIPGTLAAALVTLALAAPASASHSPRSTACFPAGSRAVVANEFVRVYTVPATKAGTRGHRRYVACSLATGRRRSLGGLDVCLFEVSAHITHVRLAGRMVGYSRTTCSQAALSDVVVRDMARGGRALFSEPAAPGRPNPVTDLEIKQNGSAVWIAEYKEAEYFPDLAGREVRVIEARLSRHAVVRDSGLDIRAGSLAMVHDESIAGTNTFYWRKGSEIRSSSLD